MEADIKKALREQGLSIPSVLYGLGRDHIIGTRAFFAFSDFECDFLVFIERGIAARLNFRMMDEQIGRTVIGSDETKTFACIEPFDCTCTHCTTPWARYRAV